MDVSANDSLAPGRTDPEAGELSRAYLDSLKLPSRKTMSQALDTVARHVAGAGVRHEDVRWDLVRRDHTLKLRAALERAYAAGMIKKLVAGLRGVLALGYRMDQIPGHDYLMALGPLKRIEPRPSRSSRLAPDQIRMIYDDCRRDTSAAGRRDAAIVAVLTEGPFTVRRLVALTIADLAKLRATCPEAVGDLEMWLKERGTAPGPVFCRLRKSGSPGPRHLRLSPQAIHAIVRDRGESAGFDGISPAWLISLRRGVSHPPLLAAIREWRWVYYPEPFAKFETEVERKAWRARSRAIRQTKRVVRQVALARKERLARHDD